MTNQLWEEFVLRGTNMYQWKIMAAIRYLVHGIVL